MRHYTVGVVAPDGSELITYLGPVRWMAEMRAADALGLCGLGNATVFETDPLPFLSVDFYWEPGPTRGRVVYLTTNREG